MPAISFEMMNHFTHMDKALKRYDLNASINFSDHLLSVENAEFSFTFHPQFQNKDGYYYSVISEDTARFIGWRPYAMKSWKKAADKVAFKKLLIQHSISTPKFYTEKNPSIEFNDVIIKQEESSFSKGIKGPFKTTKDIELNVGKREFFEQYIEGDIAKIWFWNHKPIAAEVLPNICVYGNGHSTIHELIVAHARSANKTVQTNYFKEFLAYEGKTLETVLENDVRLAIDFRYKSALTTSHQTKDTYVENHPILSNSSILTKLGMIVKNDVPYLLRKNFAYAIDVVIDGKENIWVLELNCNPHIHPFLYEKMVESLVNRV
ncbi:hypothetical protein IMCC1989_1968 [gamma proteobacterium IMCC1989]|nr:hypothetical protein IMCC1989_1968 [gamma proteobacterium IMCC1989]